jgi:hypothetical protein
MGSGKDLKQRARRKKSGSEIRASAEKKRKKIQEDQDHQKKAFIAAFGSRQVSAEKPQAEEPPPVADGDDDEFMNISVEGEDDDNVHECDDACDPPDMRATLDTEEDAPENVASESVMGKHLKAIQTRLQLELSERAPIVDTFVLNHLRANEFWVRVCHAENMCRALGVAFENQSYCQDVKMWLPHVQHGKALGMPACPRHESNSRCGIHGFRDNHFGRRVVSLQSNCYVQSCQVMCHECKDDHAAQKKKAETFYLGTGATVTPSENKEDEDMHHTFMCWNSKSLLLLPNDYGEDFPAFLTHRSGVDKLIIDLMRPLFNKGLKPASFAQTLLELHSKRFTKDWIKHEIELQKNIGDILGGRDHEMFSAFNDKLKYD